MAYNYPFNGWVKSRKFKTVNLSDLSLNGSFHRHASHRIRHTSKTRRKTVSLWCLSSQSVNNFWSCRNTDVVTSHNLTSYEVCVNLSTFGYLKYKLRRIETSHIKTVFTYNLVLVCWIWWGNYSKFLKHNKSKKRVWTHIVNHLYVKWAYKNP